jgi:hypothetical protein
MPAGGDFAPEVNNLRLRRDTFVTVRASLVTVIKVPFAIMETFELGRVYLISRRFRKELVEPIPIGIPYVISRALILRVMGAKGKTFAVTRFCGTRTTT